MSAAVVIAFSCAAVAGTGLHLPLSLYCRCTEDQQHTLCSAENARLFRSITATQTPLRRHPPPDDDCGHAPRADTHAVPQLTVEAAIAAIESTFPDRVFLTKGSECCVCLDAFGAAAEGAAAAKESAQHVTRLLRELDPSVTALRCVVRC